VKWFQRIMMGRYGSDQFNLALLLLSILLSLLSRMTDWIILLAVSYVPLFFAIFRMFSRNIQKRRAENAWFMKRWGPVSLWIRQKIGMLRQSKNFRFFRCPNCKTTVRVPKGKGKIQIRCPNCGNSFVKKS